MNKQERNELKHKVYTLWYNTEDEDKKQTYKKMLKLIDYAEDLRATVKSVNKLFAGMM